MIEYIRNLEAPINLEDLARDIFQEVDDENIAAVRVSLGRYVLRERDYEFDVPPMYKKIKNRKQRLNYTDLSLLILVAIF